MPPAIRPPVPAKQPFWNWNNVTLTPRQTSVLHAVETLTAQQGYPPTSREIARYAGLSESRVRQHLEAIEHRGAISREVGTARGIRIVSSPRE